MTTTPALLSDPRPSFAAATAWVTSLLHGVTADHLDLPTPCDDFDVRALAQHLGAVALRAEALATVGTVEGQPFRVDKSDGASYAAVIARAIAAWETAPLDRDVDVPWGTVPGFAALGMYVNETLVHGWDLAVATGQSPEFGDGSVPESVLPVVKSALPAEIRGLPDVPFGPVVEPRAEAGPTERLANWNGRSAQGWIGG